MELLQFYALAFVVVSCASVALTLTGEHTLPRGSSLEIFTLAQFSLMGHLVANIWTEHSGLCLLTSGLFYFFGKFILSYFSKRIKVTDPLMIAFYLFILSIQYFIITYFPVLDGHMTVGVFGSVVTSSFYENLFMIFVFVLGSLFFLYKRKDFLKHTVEKSLLDARCFHPTQELIISIVLITSLFGLGIIYTLSFMLIPWVLAGHLFKNQKNALLSICLLTIISSIVGLYFSIVLVNISTTPAQIIILTMLCSLIYLMADKIDSFTKSK